MARTLKKLRAGDPVEHCYGPQQGNMVTAERRQELQRLYHFHCRSRPTGLVQILTLCLSLAMDIKRWISLASCVAC